MGVSNSSMVVKADNARNNLIFVETFKIVIVRQRLNVRQSKLFINGSMTFK